jgi:hypothetical protein
VIVIAKENLSYYDNDLYPCKILEFVKVGNDEIHAIAHCCEENNHEMDGILTERWKKEFINVHGQMIPILRLVSTEAVDDCVLVVEDEPGITECSYSQRNALQNGVTLLKPREEAWANEFLDS